MTNPRVHRIPAALGIGLCTSLLIAGCGTSAGPSSAELRSASAAASAAEASASAAVASASASSAAAAVLTAKLNPILLQRSDLPAKYKQTPYEDDSDADSGPLAVAESNPKCSVLGDGGSDSDDIDDVNSSNYTLGSLMIWSSANGVDTKADFDNDQKALRDPRVPGCYATMLRSILAGDATPGTKITEDRVTIARGYRGSPRNLAGLMTITIKLTYHGQHRVINEYAAFIVGPDLVEVDVNLRNINAPVPTALRNAVIAKVAARAAKA